MTKYNLSTPDWLWRAYKQTVPHSQTLEEPIVDHLAERVRADRSLDDETRRRAAEFLGKQLPEDDTAPETALNGGEDAVETGVER